MYNVKINLPRKIILADFECEKVCTDNLSEKIICADFFNLEKSEQIFFLETKFLLPLQQTLQQISPEKYLRSRYKSNSIF